MHKVRAIVLAAIVICAAVAAYFWWPSDPPQQPASTPPVQQPVRPATPTLPPLQPAPDAGPVAAQKNGVAPEEDEAASVPEPPSEEQTTSVANLTLPFFDDLAGQVVASYHPARSGHNAENNGVLLLSLPALNRRYGVELIGLDHASSDELEAREEIFQNLLRSEVIDTAWRAFGAYFIQALIDQSLATERSFAAPDGVHVEQPLSVGQVSEFLHLLSESVHRIAQSVRIYARSDQSVARTSAFLEARSKALTANSRYQYVDAMLEEVVRESPADQGQANALRLERNTAAQEILQAIDAREHAKEHLLALYDTEALSKNMPEADLLYISQWLYRRLHDNPERGKAVVSVSERMRQFAADLRSAAVTITTSEAESRFPPTNPSKQDSPI